jgi:hypothetical protein
VRSFPSEVQEARRAEGYDDEVKFLTEACGDSICPAICMNDACDYATGMADAAEAAVGAAYAADPIAAISGRLPTRFSTRVKL